MQEQQRKASKDQADIALKQSQQEIEKARIMAQTATQMKQIDIDALKTAAQIKDAHRGRKMEHSVDAAKILAQQEHDMKKTAMQHTHNTKTSREKMVADLVRNKEDQNFQREQTVNQPPQGNINE